MNSNYFVFCEQLNSVIEKYSNLFIREVNGKKYLKGILDIPNDNNEIIKSFAIEIHFKDGFPYRFPNLKEVGYDIPNDADWHKYTNGNCCITVEPEEILICRFGITLLTFIEQHAIPYFANQIHKKEFGFYKNGEYAHGFSGLKQFYSSLFQTNDESRWVYYTKIVFKNFPLHIQRNDKCFCGSNKKFKHCHNIVFNQMRIIGLKQIVNDLKINIDET